MSNVIDFQSRCEIKSYYEATSLCEWLKLKYNKSASWYNGCATNTKACIMSYYVADMSNSNPDSTTVTVVNAYHKAKGKTETDVLSYLQGYLAGEGITTHVACIESLTGDDIIVPVTPDNYFDNVTNCNVLIVPHVYKGVMRDYTYDLQHGFYSLPLSEMVEVIEALSGCEVEAVSETFTPSKNLKLMS